MIIKKAPKIIKKIDGTGWYADAHILIYPKKEALKTGGTIKFIDGLREYIEMIERCSLYSLDPYKISDIKRVLMGILGTGGFKIYITSSIFYISCSGENKSGMKLIIPIRGTDNALGEFNINLCKKYLLNKSKFNLLSVSQERVLLIIDNEKYKVAIMNKIKEAQG